MIEGVSMFPRKTRLGEIPLQGERRISIAPVIKDGRSYGGYRAPDRLEAYKITVSGNPPNEVVDKATTFAFEVAKVGPVETPPEDQYDVRFFFEQVEWKELTGKWTFGADELWDAFITEEMGKWSNLIPIQFLGIARRVDGPSRDSEVRELTGSDGPLLGCWYRLPRKKAA